MDLDNNQLSGAIPKELGNISNLNHLRLNNNRLSGTLPAELGNLEKLRVLELNYNQLNGTIPTSIGNLSMLIHLDLSHNRFEGDVPASITYLQRLCVEGSYVAPCYGYHTTDFGYNRLNVPQPEPPQAFLYEKDPDWDKTQNLFDPQNALFFPLVER